MDLSQVVNHPGESQQVSSDNTKMCFKCGKIKSLDEFYKHSRMKDGHVNKCKECNKADVSKNYHKNVDHYKDYDRGRARLSHRVQARTEYSITTQGKAKRTAANRAYRDRNPEKYKAHELANGALRAGKIKKQPCFVCGKKEVEGHHYDYSKPLDVIWLCQEHHGWMHHKTAI